LSDVAGEGEIYADVKETGRLGKMAGLYSHFRPVPPEDRRVWKRNHPAGGAVPGVLAKSEEELVSQTVDLESHELFSQLCTITNLVKVGPNRGLFLSCVNIGDGLTRVWRNWLSDRASANEKGIETKEEFESRLLWADSEQHVGLRLRVSRDADAHAPILLAQDEDVSVSYKLEYEGESFGEKYR
jgi:hypothetical protein